MAERPIIFSGPMVRAILDGRKSQTRRIATFKPREEGLNLGFSGLSVGHYCTGVPTSGWVLCSRGGGGCWNDRTFPLHCPYGVPGDRLWARETFLLRAAGKHAVYRAEFDPVDAAGFGAMYGGWKPSIHMPRWASRITLEVVSVRVERLQEISEGDAFAEGIDGEALHRAKGYAPDAFRKLWDSINAKRAPWESNPYVWVIEFKRAP